MSGFKGFKAAMGDELKQVCFMISENSEYEFEICPEFQIITVRPLGEYQRVMGVIRGDVMKVLMEYFGDYHAIVRFISKHDVKRIVGLNPYCDVIFCGGERGSCCEGNGSISTFIYNGVHEYNDTCEYGCECIHDCAKSRSLLYVLECLGVEVEITPPHVCECEDLYYSDDVNARGKFIKHNTANTIWHGHPTAVSRMIIEDGRVYLNFTSGDDCMTLQNFVSEAMFGESTSLMLELVSEIVDYSDSCTENTTGCVNIGEWYEYYDEKCKCSTCFSIQVLLRYRLRALKVLVEEEDLLLE
jgi:hypothetical protein